MISCYMKLEYLCHVHVLALVLAMSRFLRQLLICILEHVAISLFYYNLVGLLLS